jgi:hypothetical protein
MQISCKGTHLEPAILLTRLWWGVAYRLSDRHLEQMRQGRGMDVAPATMQRWILQSPQLEEAFRRPRLVWLGGEAGDAGLTAADPFCALAASDPSPPAFTHL